MVWVKNLLKRLWHFIKYPYVWIKEEIKFRKKLKELRKRDPFIYN